MNSSILWQKIPAQLITKENFSPYGQVIFPQHHSKMFDEEDAQLNLQSGQPRFYIMRLHQAGRKFHQITRHQQCTQCLGSLAGKEWFIVVAPPSPSPVPNREQMKAFRIPGNCFIKLEVGTWHAGPYFDGEFVDFYNLELSDTNLVDHLTYNFRTSDGLELEIV